jgi:hypothetical protein
MMNRLWNPAAWLAILAVITMSCSTTINVIPQDYSRIDPSNMFRIITVDDHTYEATNLVVKDNVATFSWSRRTRSRPARWRA